MRKRILWVGGVLLWCGSLFAQDIHFSMLQSAPLATNPALTGVFYGNQRFGVAIRNQWGSVPVDYTTFTASYDRKFLPCNPAKAPKSWFSGGLNLFYDVAGDSKLNNTTLGLSGAYTRKLNSRHSLTGGLQVAGSQRAFKLDDLNFDEQYDYYKGFNINLPTGESFDNTTRFYASVGAGVNWEYQKPNSRTGFTLGVGAFHLNRPTQNFYEETEKSRLEPRLSLHGAGNLKLSANTDLMLNVLQQWQGPHKETVIGLFGKFYINHTPTREMALALGLLFRAGDAVNPAAIVFYKDWEAGLSYDLNFSDFDRATNNVGGPEFFVKYYIRCAPDLTYCPTCKKFL